jgi:hypothetical protein
MTEPRATDASAAGSLQALEVERLSLALNELQAAVPHHLSALFADSLASTTRHVAPDLAGPQTDIYDARLSLLQRQGYASLGQPLNLSQVEEIHRHFESCPCFAAHVAAKSDGVERTVEQCAAIGQQGSYRTSDILLAPHLLELANRDDLLTLMEAYLGCVPSIYSVNAFWTFPGGTALIPGLQTYHRDFDDFHFCTLFVFLSDVQPGDGAHYFLRTTHRPDLMERQLVEAHPGTDVIPEMTRLFARLAAIDEAGLGLFLPHRETVGGPAGTCVLENTYGLHKGEPPQTKRLLAWIRYGLYRNAANLSDKITPVPRHLVAGRIPDTPRHRYINRLIVEP